MSENLESMQEGRPVRLRDVRPGYGATRLVHQISYGHINQTGSLSELISIATIVSADALSLTIVIRGISYLVDSLRDYF